jgi:hypothetical protein
MKIEKFQLRGNHSLSAVAFHLLRGHAPAQLSGNIDYDVDIYLFTFKFTTCF